MMQFNFAASTDDFNDIIELNYELAMSVFNSNKPADYDEKVKLLNEGIAKYITSGTRAAAVFEKDGLACLKNPTVIKNKDVMANFDTVIAQMINPVLPMVSNNDLLSLFAETKQVGWGDNARFIIKSNELYKVNEIAKGVHRGVLQNIRGDEMTVEASPIELAFEADWYAMAAGVFDWGDHTIRVAKSFENYIYLKAIAALLSVGGEMSSAYTQTGFSDIGWTNLAQLVSAANGGSDVYAIGTLSALGQVLPAAPFQYVLGQKIADDGMLDRFKGVRLVPTTQAIGYNQVNVAGDFGNPFIVPDDKIFMVPVAGYKPVKIVYEGDTIYAERAPEHTPDNTYRVNIQMMIGVAAVIGSKMGTIDL